MYKQREDFDIKIDDKEKEKKERMKKWKQFIHLFNIICATLEV